MTQYMLSVPGSGEPPYADDEDAQAAYAATGIFNEQLQADGVWVFAGGLQPIETATTIDATGSEAVVTDGPYTEAKEWLGGFWIIDVPDLDAAMRYAEAGSRACRGQVEVRPFQGE